MVVTSVEVAVNRLAPAWEGVELGLEEEIIIKAIAASCGMTTNQLKTNIHTERDLGLVAEQNRDGDLFQPTILAVCNSS